MLACPCIFELLKMYSGADNVLFIFHFADWSGILWRTAQLKMVHFDYQGRKHLSMSFRPCCSLENTSCVRGYIVIAMRRALCSAALSITRSVSSMPCAMSGCNDSRPAQGPTSVHDHLLRSSAKPISQLLTLFLAYCPQHPTLFYHHQLFPWVRTSCNLEYLTPSDVEQRLETLHPWSVQ